MMYATTAMTTITRKSVGNTTNCLGHQKNISNKKQQQKTTNNKQQNQQ